MTIKGIAGRSVDEVNQELQKGAKFVIYEYCVSILILTFKRGSDIFFIPAGESRVGKGLVYSLISFFFGWWGIPWGPIYTIASIVTNFGGGKDVTPTVLASFNSQS
jgi:hypothetical protein